MTERSNGVRTGRGPSGGASGGPGGGPGGGGAGGDVAAPADGYRAALDVRGRDVLVVGNGSTAWRAARRLLLAGAVVTVVSPTGRWRDDADWASLLSADVVSRAAVLAASAPGSGLPDADLRVVRSPDRGFDPPGGWRALLRRTWLVQLATTDTALALDTTARCEDQRVWCVQADADDLERERSARRGGPAGDIVLVGGGPGDPALLTHAARAALRAADVVLVDRLAPRDGLAALAPGAVVLDVGKTPGHHGVPQDRIEEELVAHARAGARVVRLKGGDPYVFGRGGEEVIAARAAGVPVRVVPGVSSALAVPAAAGIPVTHREVSRAFTVVSGHAPLGEDELAGLVRLGGTIIVLMGVATLPHLSAGLLRHGASPDLPAAVVERGCTDGQRTTTSVLGRISADALRAGVRSPAVVVLGEVVALADQLAGAVDAATAAPPATRPAAARPARVAAPASGPLVGSSPSGG